MVFIDRVQQRLRVLFIFNYRCNVSCNGQRTTHLLDMPVVVSIFISSKCVTRFMFCVITSLSDQ